MIRIHYSLEIILSPRKYKIVFTIILWQHYNIPRDKKEVIVWKYIPTIFLPWFFFLKVLSPNAVTFYGTRIRASIYGFLREHNSPCNTLSYPCLLLAIRPTLWPKLARMWHVGSKERKAKGIWDTINQRISNCFTHTSPYIKIATLGREVNQAIN